VAQSRKPAPAPTFDTSRVVGGVELDLPMTLGELQRRLDSDAHHWQVSLTDRGCKGNLETLTADTRAIEAEIYCTAGASAQPNNSVVRITAGAPFGGTQYLNFQFSGSYADYGETVYSITLGDSRYFIYSIPVPVTRP